MSFLSLWPFLRRAFILREAFSCEPHVSFDPRSDVQPRGSTKCVTTRASLPEPGETFRRGPPLRVKGNQMKSLIRPVHTPRCVCVRKKEDEGVKSNM